MHRKRNGAETHLSGLEHCIQGGNDAVGAVEVATAVYSKSELALVVAHAAIVA
jgi:hypothetical protein